MNLRVYTLVTGVLFFHVPAALSEVHQQTYSVELGASRIIYPPGGKNSSVRVVNNQGYPVLVRSQVVSASDRKTPAPFITTPPLFRLDGHQSSVVTITRTGGNFPTDRESLNWLCVTAIPPEKDSEWAKNRGDKSVVNNIQVVLENCIKLLIRPDGLNSNPVDTAGEVTWHTEGKNLRAHNPTPYYMSISGIRFSGEKLKIKDSYIAPFTDENIPLTITSKKDEKVTWTVIGDYGEEKEIKSEVK